MTPILHEVIHHACANTAVNVALQHRWLELLRLVVSAPGFGYGINVEHISVAEDLAAVEAVLQPLAEGIAHFAEFDCPVPESRMGRNIMIGPSDALLWRLLSLKEVAGDAHMDALCAQLRSQQLDSRTIQRKTDVLCNPIRPKTGNDSYLLGYLIVRTLWNRFAGEPTGLRATSFLNFVMYYIYEDWELARILLSAGRIPIDQFRKRVVSRISALFSSALGPRVIAFTEDNAARIRQRGTLKRGPEERKHGIFKGLDLTNGQVRAGMDSLIRFFDERVGPVAAIADQDERVSGITNLQHKMLMSAMDPRDPNVIDLLFRHRVIGSPPVRLLDFVLDIPLRKRAFCFLVDLPVEIRGRNGNELLISTREEFPATVVLQSDAAARFSLASQAGRLVAVITSTAIPWRFYGFLFHGGSVVCAWSTDSPDENERNNLIQTIAREIEMETYAQLSLPMLNDFITRNEQVRARLAQSADQATCAVADDLWALLDGAGWSALGRGTNGHDLGIRNVVPKMSGVRAIAATSVCSAFRTDRAEISALMETAGYHFPDALECSANIERDTGIRLISINGERVHVNV